MADGISDFADNTNSSTPSDFSVPSAGAGISDFASSGADEPVISDHAPEPGYDPLKNIKETTGNMTVGGPLHSLANGVRLAGAGIADVAGAVGKGYDLAVGRPTAATQGIADLPKTALELGAEAEQIPEGGLKRLVSAATGQGLDISPKPWSEIIHGLPGMSHLPEEIRKGISEDVGVLAEPLADPLWAVGGLTTKAGKEARLAGMAEPNVAKAAEAGHLIGGQNPIISPIYKAIGAGQTALRKAAPGFHTMTENPEINKLIETKLKSPESYANVQADVQGNDLNKAIDRNAALQDKTPEQMNQEMMDYREPPTSQVPKSDINVEDYRANSNLPAEIKDLLDEQIKKNAGYSEQAGEIPNDTYLHHTSTPEWKKFKEKNLPDLVQGAESGAPKSDAIASDEDRAIFPNHTANEVNNLASQGRLSEAMPGAQFPGTADKFTGKVFSDNLAQIEARRYLQNAKVSRVSDFMDSAQKTFGKTPEALKIADRAGEINPKDWQQVNSDHFEGGKMWFPKDMADFMNGLQNPKNQSMVQGWGKQFLNNTSTAVKLANFGIKLGSAPFNYLSNLNMAFLNRLLSPKNVGKALNIVTKDRLGALSDKVVLHSPVHGDITEKRLMDMAHKNRGIGMGLERSILAAGDTPDWMRNNPVTKAFMNMHMYAEDASRLPTFMTALEKGADEYGAGVLTRNTAYDYGDLGPVDQRFAQWMPFYRFARQNMPTMMRRAVTDPARFFAVEKTREAWNKKNGQQENEKLLPQFTRESEPWYVGKNDKQEPLWMNGPRIFTQNDVNHLLGESDENGSFHPIKSSLEYFWSLMNPFIKTAPELAENYNTAYHAPIAKLPEANHGMGEMVNLAPGIDLPAKPAYALNQFSPFSAARNLGDENIPWWSKFARQALNINVQPQDVDQAQNLKDAMQKHGIHQAKGTLRSFAIKEQNDELKNKPHQAELDAQNAEDAFQELLKRAENFGK